MKLAIPSFVVVGFLASLAACSRGSPSPPEGVRVEFAEVVPGSPVRPFYSAEGTPQDLEVKSSVVMHGSVLRVFDVPDDEGSFFGLHAAYDPPKPTTGPTHEEFEFQLSKADDAAFTAWTRNRLDQNMAVIIGDQVVALAAIRSPLSGPMPIRVPKSIRDEGLREAIVAARQTKKPSTK